MAISREFIETLNDRLSIEDVVSSYVTLKRTGKNLQGLCPFHSEKTPSFTLFPDTNSFYCFGCQAAGDVLSFIMRIENLDWIEAVKAAAQRANMAMPEDGYDDSMAKLRVRILNANREAARFFNSQLMLPENKEALDYFLNRGLTLNTITKFGLGYAPDEWRALTNHLKSKGFNEQELVLANLARKKDGSANCYDNFRNRVIFPIIDLRGNVVAFGGRVIDDSNPKYINTSDTPVYKKGEGVFALNFAKNNELKRLILVEGYMDVIALHQAGFTNAVACLGTAFTQEQARLLSRFADEIFICYDNDEAGRKATSRAMKILGKTGLNVKIVNMDGGKDADQIIRERGKDKFASNLSAAANEVEFKLGEILKKYNIQTDDGKNKFLTEASSLLAYCKPIEADIYISRLSQMCDVNRDSIEAQVNYARKQLDRQKKYDRAKAERKLIFSVGEDKNNPEKKDNLRAAKAEDVLIASLMRNPDFYQKIKDKFSPEDFITTFNKRIITHLIQLIEGGYSTSISMFSSEFTPQEMDSIARLARMGADGLKNSIAECLDCVEVLKKQKQKQNLDPLTMSDEEYRSFIAKKAGGKKNEK